MRLAAANPQLDGPDSALRILLDGIDMGDEKIGLAAILQDFNNKLHTGLISEYRRSPDRPANPLLSGGICDFGTARGTRPFPATG